MADDAGEEAAEIRRLKAELKAALEQAEGWKESALQWEKTARARKEKLDAWEGLVNAITRF